MHSRILLPLAIVIAAAAPSLGRAASFWVEQGPGPIFNGGVSGLPADPAAGAVNAIVADPANAGQLLIGTVNGGIWATADADSPVPLWTPLTDQLPALSIASLAASPVRPGLVFAGTGSTSSFAGEGSPGFGVLRSTDGGLTWRVLAGATFAGQVVDAIVPTRLANGAVALAATRKFPAQQEVDQDAAAVAAGAAAQATPTRGIFRSTNAGAGANAVAFTPVSGRAGSGLPAGGVSALIADPLNRNRFYAGLSFFDGAAKGAGVYRSDDGGVTWKQVNGSGAKVLGGLANSVRILLSIHAGGGSNAVYAAVIRFERKRLGVPVGGVLSGVFRSADGGVSWTSFGVPAQPVFPGGQGDLHGALAADPGNRNVAFIAGDSQRGPFPNANGCRDFVATVFRLDIAAQPPAMRWQNVVCDGAAGTAPHADARNITFDGSGDLLLANDGGVYRLIDPNLPNLRRWQPVIGNLRPTEFHSVAYDPLSKVVIGGTQDNGTVVQSSPGSFAWNELQGGDGGVVAIDADQSRHPGTTLRYTSAQEFGGFMRTTWDAANNVLDQRFLRLFVSNGRGVCVGRTLFACDADTDEIQFYNPYVLNTINPRRVLIGTDALYESFDQGDTLGALTGNTRAPIAGLAYGGRRGGRNFPGIIYAGNGNAILHRVDNGGKIVTLTYPGSAVRALAINSFDYTQIAVLDDRNRVWLSAAEGKPGLWLNLTGNLASLTGQVQSIAFCSPNAMLAKSVLVAGGFGVFQLRVPGSGSNWSRLGSGIPNALVLDLHYDQTNDLLLAASLGRGAWTLPGFLKGGPAPVAVAANAAAPAIAPAPYDISVSPMRPAAMRPQQQSLP